MSKEVEQAEKAKQDKPTGAAAVTQLADALRQGMSDNEKETIYRLGFRDGVVAAYDLVGQLAERAVAFERPEPEPEDEGEPDAAA